jgi:hypothetical protein
MRAIETHYKGYRFRSRLEARWAVFFDSLGIEWVYEPEGFELSDGSRYLPDFWLPSFSGGMWAEVKPDGGDFSKARALCQESKRSVWLCEGVPDYRAYDIFEFCEADENVGGEGRVQLINGVPNADQAEGGNRMFWLPGYENSDGSIPPNFHDCLGHCFVEAVHAVSQARFEFER